MVHLAEVNYVAVLLATITTMVLGFLWYSPVLLGNAWMKQRGLTKSEMSGGGAFTYVLTALTALGGAFILALLLTLADETTIWSGLVVGVNRMSWLQSQDYAITPFLMPQSKFNSSPRRSRLAPKPLFLCAACGTPSSLLYQSMDCHAHSHI
jgi:hypothetical protein